MLQPIVTRDQNENLMPLIRKTFKVLSRAGRIPPPPDELLEFIQTPVDINFSGPVAMLAKRHLQMQGFNSTIPQVLALAKEAPQLSMMLDRLDPDAVYDYIMTAGGAPAKVTRDERQVMQIRQQRQKQMEAQQRQEAMNKAADTLHKGSVAPEDGSPSQKVLEAQQ